MAIRLKKRDLKRLERLIGQLEAWQNSANLDRNDNYEVQSAKQKLMAILDKYSQE
jgi:hypothetical protein